MSLQPFLQVVLGERDGRTSGAEIRNTANFEAASNLGAGEVFTLERLDRGATGAAAPTVAAVAPHRIDALLERVGVLRPRFMLFEGVALLAALAATRRAFPGLSLVLDCHNVESSVEAATRGARLPVPVRFLTPLLQRRALRRSRAADRDAARLSDAVWFCSRVDLEAARELSPLPQAHVVPNPIPRWALGTDHASRFPGEEVLFVGHLGYAPNRRAVEELCSSIMPRLRRMRPDARLHVCGRRPSPALAREVETAGGRLTPDPDDLAGAYRRAGVVAVPLREGGGTRIKILEALAVGRPVVATAKAVEGLGLVPGGQYVRAETPAEFAAAIAGLFNDGDAARSLAVRGRAHVLAAFGPEARQAAVREALGALVSPPPR